MRNVKGTYLSKKKWPKLKIRKHKKEKKIQWQKQTFSKCTRSTKYKAYMNFKRQMQ